MCGFSVDHVSSIDDSAVKLNEAESILRTVQIVTALSLWNQSFDQMLDQHLTRPAEEQEEKEEEEDTIKYTCQFDAEYSTTVMCNKIENNSYKLISKGKKKQKTTTELLKKYCN
jgi:PDZ domain-containing secreted protein